MKLKASAAWVDLTSSPQHDAAVVDRHDPVGSWSASSRHAAHPPWGRRQVVQPFQQPQRRLGGPLGK
jgi:hypothetical protein